MLIFREAVKMATIIGEKDLKKYISESNIIENGDEKCAEGIKYDFRLGDEFAKTGFVGTATYEELRKDKKDYVAPGEVVFVKTKERLNLPQDIHIILHEKRTMSQAGINLLGGRGVDPNYEGYLFFGLYNFSSKDYPLKPESKLIGATFHRLADDEIVHDAPIPRSWDDFPEELRRFVDDYSPIDPVALSDELKKLRESQDRFEDTNNSLLNKMDEMNNHMRELSEMKGSLRTLKWALGLGVPLITGLIVTIVQLLFRLYS